MDRIKGGSISIIDPVGIRMVGLREEREFRMEILACFEAGKEKHNVKISFDYRVEDGEVVPRKGAKFISEELMTHPEFSEYLKKNAVKDAQKFAPWKIRLDVHPVWRSVTVFEVFFVWSDDSMQKIGDFVVIERPEGHVEEMTVEMLGYYPLLGYVVPQPEKAEAFLRFLKALFED